MLPERGVARAGEDFRHGLGRSLPASGRHGHARLEALGKHRPEQRMRTLQERSKVRSLKENRVFVPVKEDGKQRSLREAWERALATAEIENFHWHDLRHTAASYLVMSGVSLVEVAKILGHRTLAMVARYAHLADEHIVATGEKLAARLGVA